MSETLIVLIILIVIIILAIRFGKTPKTPSEYQAYLIGKYKGEKELEKGKEYVIRVTISYPQSVTVHILNTGGYALYPSLNKFYEVWEPIHHDADKMQVYLGGKFESISPGLFSEKVEITNYDTTRNAYIKNLFESYYKENNENLSELEKILQNLKSE